MPYAKKYVKKNRKRRFRPRRYPRQTPTTAKGPLAVKLPSKFIYSDYFDLNPGVAGIPDTKVFSLNGLFDPDITGVGHQPRGFDQLVGNLYDHYVVIGAKASIWAQNADTADGMLLTCRVTDSATVTTDPRDIMENRYTRIMPLAPEGSGNNVGRMTIKVNPNKFLGRSKPLSDPQLKGNNASNPTEQAFLQVSAFPMNNAVDAGACRFYIKLEYQAVLIEPRLPTIS